MTPIKAVKFTDINDETVPYVYPDVWQKQQTTGPERIVFAPASGQTDLIIELTRLLPEPFGILYVLLVPRTGENEPSRYQSGQPCDRNELEAFLNQFRDFFECDGRHHLRIMSLSGQAQIIYDNHNLIYAYGPLDMFVSAAEANGLTQGAAIIPSPHAHHYNAPFDADERALLNYWEWLWFPLAEGD